MKKRKQGRRFHGTSHRSSRPRIIEMEPEDLVVYVHRAEKEVLRIIKDMQLSPGAAQFLLAQYTQTLVTGDPHFTLESVMNVANTILALWQAGFYTPSDEDHFTQEMVTLAISTTPGRKERCLHFKLSHPLTPHQWRELTRLKVAGMFSAFFVSDETAEETQTLSENDQSQNEEEGAESVRKVRKLGNLTGRLIATQTYPSILREKDALEITAHLLWDALRGEEPVAETFGLSYASGYLEYVRTLDTQA